MMQIIVKMYGKYSNERRQSDNVLRNNFINDSVEPSHRSKNKPE